MIRSLGYRLSNPVVTRYARSISLQVEKSCATLADKIVRGRATNVFYTHPSYVMAREKMLYTLWVDSGVFLLSLRAMLPFFCVALFFKA
ncbi:uncharacterized protein TEOVI_000820700 [Trypanosoma equiperdum]|uniref:Uncharacterized protein n=4 Tax=Trypanozoon TaxID=39700 RepID=Q57TS4_TRYB2|nr:hypothetical protein, conserved [Trypanosoma brucei gambiense DAL972]XP_847519.1 hypothetical protein, conserved [Trypanosoma brucei brucei TREU927]AAX80050.1 hypothetical protein, conserved [Trypanosoma brucei]RHW73086.1 hypothetical protein DPX39_040048400 [Trypanosoma brucei equiperdum]SCU67728.1 hypothetical protein, conserved [Trypanosoma equiperdum]AAZ13453.1 hypothetical protein, conserved [Trypanosoma brucei brucei TREU927]CBH13764.1 hypothetical protein, conserved [Trypanosoma bru|eukprot:XP_011776040.1 hypothetical protein, conserved [Trypanosoma brucei gambiense DAL972]